MKPRKSPPITAAAGSAQCMIDRQNDTGRWLPGAWTAAADAATISSVVDVMLGVDDDRGRASSRFQAAPSAAAGVSG
jgi:hypothetical protein